MASPDRIEACGLARCGNERRVSVSAMDELPGWIAKARAHWTWRGAARPAFGVEPGVGEESVWDYPRPPAIVDDAREVVVRWNGRDVVRTRRAVRVLETAHPPSFYLPWDDAMRSLFARAEGASFCEWKGPAQYWDLVDGDARIAGVAWSYPSPLAGAEVLADRVAFYASRVDCYVDGARVLPQPGGFYGGWITPELTGPFKGDPGSTGW